MSEPFLAEIRLFSFNFAPRGWALCNGQLLPINQNQALFSLLGTIYGGDGRVNFALPDLRGRVPLHPGSGFTLGQRGGEEAHTLALSEMPGHGHPVSASSSASGGSPIPTGRYLGGATGMYHAPASLTSLRTDTVANSGGGQPHTNLQPYLTISLCIALQGIFPSMN